MKSSIIVCLSVSTILTIYACAEKKSEEASNEYLVADSSSILIENKQNTNTNFQNGKNTIIRTAEIKFRVENVQKASEKIEDLVNLHNGIISYSNLNTSIENRTTTQISSDSLLERTQFNVSNTIVIKVPNKFLDITLREISSLIDFLDNKTVKAEDVYLQLLSNQLKIKRNTTLQNNQTKNADIQNNNLNMLENKDEAIVSNISLKQQIAFSTITLEIYQKNSITDTKIVAEKVIIPYETPFHLKLWESVLYGLTIIESIVLLIIRLWVLILFAILAYIFYKKYFKYKV